MYGCKWQDLSRSDAMGGAPATAKQRIGRVVIPGKSGRYLVEVHTSAVLAPQAGVPDGNMELVIGNTPVATLCSAPPSQAAHNGARIICRISSNDEVYVRCLFADTGAGQRYLVNYLSLTLIADKENPVKE